MRPKTTRSAEELLADPEGTRRAHHVVDLGRNDVGRVSEFGSVRVTDQMVIERYSHVMHIVSHVDRAVARRQDRLRRHARDLPGGHRFGRAQDSRHANHPGNGKSRRGLYSGIVGYFGFDGTLDTCIALRSIVLKNGRAYFQTGAGIVADSVPAREYEETVNKAKAMLDAIARTEGMTK